MPHRTKKLRGSRTHGRGKKHGRGKGCRGGHGNAGLHKHKFKWMLIYDPDHFGAHGFFRHAQGTEPETTINLEILIEQLPALEASGAATRAGTGFSVDLTKAGVDKLLGSGRVPIPLTIQVASASEKAIAKVAGAGGAVNLPGKK
ncbi:MAG TPA: uL15 family ribosomal protein [Thermoplasmata archaeon]|nr:uL15 family ribosomal protein [Thermoplasmata archaeon]